MHPTSLRTPAPSVPHSWSRPVTRGRASRPVEISLLGLGAMLAPLALSTAGSTALGSVNTAAIVQPANDQGQDAAEPMSFITGDLPRSGFLGVGLAPEPEGAGMTVTSVVPGGPAEAAGLQAGDIILSVGDAPLDTSADLAPAMAGRRAGDTVKLQIRRTTAPGEGAGEAATTKELDIDFTFGPRPLATHPKAHVEYGDVRTPDGYRVRSILTLPVDAEGPIPCVYIIQGIPCSTADYPLSGLSANYVSLLVDQLTHAGIATWRVEKPGCGDSEGPPCLDMGFDEELRAFNAGLEHLMSMDEVIDVDQIFLAGFSMGAVQAPLLAAEHPEVAGVITWGTVVQPWFEYMVNNFRERQIMQQADPEQMRAFMEPWKLYWAELLIAEKSVDAIAAEHPELQAVVGDLVRPAGRHALFHQELDNRDLYTAWVNVQCPVLLLHGEYDWVASEGDHRSIAALVNRDNPDQATFMLIPQLDHAMVAHHSLAISFDRLGQGSTSPLVAGAIAAWVEDHVEPADVN